MTKFGPAPSAKSGAALGDPVAERVPRPDAGDAQEDEPGFLGPHKSLAPASLEHIQELAQRVAFLAERGNDVFESLCCESREYGRVDLMTACNGVGSGDIWWELGIIDVDWPGPERKQRGKDRRKWR